MASTVAIIIPSCNRPQFMLRQLRYYAEVGSPHTIYIGDSSTEENFAAIAQAVDELSGRVQIRLERLPGASGPAAILHLLSTAIEEFACFSGDDDFQIPSSLTRSAEFLAANPTFATARGRAILFVLSEDGPYGEIHDYSEIPQPVFAEPTASARVSRYLSSDYYTTLFSVNRRTNMVAAFKKAAGLADISTEGELLPGALAIASGRSALLDTLGFLRQTHSQRYSLSSAYGWVRSAAWRPSVDAFLDAVSGEISARDGIPREMAFRTVEESFAAYCSNRFAKDAAQPPATIRSRLREAVRQGVPYHSLDRALNLAKRLETRIRLRRAVLAGSRDLRPVIDAIRKSRAHPAS